MSKETYSWEKRPIQMENEIHVRGKKHRYVGQETQIEVKDPYILEKRPIFFGKNDPYALEKRPIHCRPFARCVQDIWGKRPFISRHI